MKRRVRLWVEVDIVVPAAVREMTEREEGSTNPVENWTRDQIKARVRQMPAVDRVEVIYIPEMFK
jgi:hypothetical protein